MALESLVMGLYYCWDFIYYLLIYFLKAPYFVLPRDKSMMLLASLINCVHFTNYIIIHFFLFSCVTFCWIPPICDSFFHFIPAIEGFRTKAASLLTVDSQLSCHLTNILEEICVLQ